MRKLMWFSLGFGAACAFCAYLYASWLPAAAVGILILAAVLLILVRFCRGLRIPAAIALGMAAGIVWFCCFDSLQLNAARLADGQTRFVSIRVTDYSFDSSYGSAVDGNVTLDGKTYQVRAYLKEKRQLSPGETVCGEFSFRLTTVGALEDPTFHQGKGIFLLASQSGKHIALSGGSVSWRDYPAIWRHRLIGILDSALPEDAASFARALLLGDRTGIDYETSTAFKISGISHIIAVSGLHVSILFGFIYLITARNRYLTAFLGIPVVILFAAVAGFTPSVVRASIMQTLVMLALLFNKEYDGPTALSFAAVVLLVANPLVITSVSFQLSFGCMAGILLFSGKVRDWLMDDKRLGRWNNKLTRWFSGSIGVTLSAMVFTTPLVAVYFGTVSLIGVVMNLLTLWVVTIVFYGVLLICAVGLFSLNGAGVLGWPVAWLIRYILTAAKLLSRLPLAAVYTKSVYIVLWVVFCYALFVLFLIQKKKPVLLHCTLAALGLCLALTLSWIEPLSKECTVTVLDVGQGQSVILQSGGKTFLVDCGGDYDENAADMAAETLLSQGISRLDAIVVTHYDADHAGGMDELLTRLDTDLLLLPYVDDVNGAGETLAAMAPEAAVYVSEDLVLTFPNGKITVFAPFTYESSNESSMSVLFQTENCDILVVGDRGEMTERVLVQRCSLPQLEVLVAGHHGSRTSTCEELLEETLPEYALISVGAGNRYGHPAAEVLERLGRFGCRILRTDLNGTIVFRR